MKKKIQFLILILTWFFIFTTGVSAQDEIKYQEINPKDTFNYGVKRFKEKFFLAVNFSKNKKADYLLNLTDVRLAELKYTIENKDMANFETSTQRYFTTIGQYVEHLTSKKVVYDKKIISEKLDKHTPILEKLRDSFPSDTAEWRFVQDDINYLKNYLNTL